jgi:beta-glucosidase
VSSPEFVYEFPKDFLWGVSSPLIPYHETSDWADWTQLGRLKPSNHPNPLLPPTIADTLKNLGIKVFQYTLPWSLIEPTPGHFDLKVCAKLSTQLSEIRAAGIKIMLTLHSYAHPKWFHAYSPWHTTQSIKTFTCYSKKMFETFAPLVDYWIPFNDLNIFWTGSYCDGVIPPGYSDTTLATLALRNLLETHSLTYQLIKNTYSPNAASRIVGINLHQTHFAPHSRINLQDRWVTKQAHRFYNELILDALVTGKISIDLPTYQENISLPFIRGSLDFLGINYFTRTLVQHTRKQKYRFAFMSKRTSVMTDSGWEPHAPGLLHVLKNLDQYHLPLWITANGCADKQDLHRADYLFRHLSVVKKALELGINLKGYCHHSWIDGCEGLMGSNIHYGLHSILNKDSIYPLKESGHYYAGIARTHKMFVKGVI